MGAGESRQRTEETLRKENALMRARILANGGHLGDWGELDAELENEFLSSVIEFEKAPHRPVFEILGVSPRDYPPPDLLGKDDAQVRGRFERLLKVMAEHGFVYRLCDGLPMRTAYAYLVEDLLGSEISDLDGEGRWIIDGCDGCCERCFQRDYCRERDDR